MSAEYSAGEVRARRSRRATPWTKEEALSNFTPVPEAGCWLWLGKVDDKGYGKISLNGRNVFMHRFFYEAYKGAIPKGMFCCHKCDTPLCVNPDHLWIGSCADNNRDMMAKARNNFSRNKITPEIAVSIVQSVKPTPQLVAELGFSKAAIDAVRCGRSWSRATSKARSERGPRPLFFKHANRKWINE